MRYSCPLLARANTIDEILDGIDMVAVHDAARPCLVDKWIDQVFEAAERDGAAILALPVAEIS